MKKQRSRRRDEPGKTPLWFSAKTVNSQGTPVALGGFELSKDSPIQKIRSSLHEA
jgi:hypothetical protein